MSMRRRSLTFALFCATGSAATAAHGQTAGRHPDPRFIDRGIAPTSTVRLADLSTSAPLRFHGEPLVSLGKEDGPPEVVFGEITAAAFTPTGSLAILDGSQNEVRVFGQNGALRQRFGRAGSGPGEFDHPKGLAVAPDGSIVVSDLSRSLQRFQQTSAGYRPQVRRQWGIRLRSLCATAMGLFVNGLRPGDPRTVRYFRSDSAPPAAFAPLYNSPNPAVNDQFGEVRLACDPQAGAVFLMPNGSIGEVRAYRQDGSPLWRTIVTDFRANTILDRPQGCEVTLSPDGVNSGLSLTLVASIGLVAQIAYRSAAALKAGDTSIATIYTLILDPKTGRLRDGGQGVPRIAAAHDSLVMIIQDDPAPRVEVRRVAPR